jgi:hypothetical protein
MPLSNSSADTDAPTASVRTILMPGDAASWIQPDQRVIGATKPLQPGFGFLRGR